MLRALVAMVLVLALLAACGGGDDDDDEGDDASASQTVATTDSGTSEPTQTKVTVDASPTPPAATSTPVSAAATVGQWAVIEAWTPANSEVIGELLNEGTQDVLRPQVSVALYDAAGTLLGSASSCFASSRIVPGDVGGFQCSIAGVATADVADTRITVEEGFVQPGSAAAAEYATTTTLLQANWLPAGITGEYRNDGDVAIDASGIMAMLYNANGNLYAIIMGSSDVSTIAPGATSTFTLRGISDKSEPADMRILINSRVNASAAAAAPTATPGPAVPTIEPTNTPALEAPDAPLADVLPPLSMFPAGWTVEYPATESTGEDSFCGVSPASSVSPIKEQIEGEYTAGSGATFLSVSIARLEDAIAVVNSLVDGATCTEWESEGAVWRLQEMSFPEVGDGPQWVRAATVASEGIEFAVQIVVFRVGDAMVLVGHVGFGGVDTDLTVQVVEYVADALD